MGEYKKYKKLWLRKRLTYRHSQKQNLKNLSKENRYLRNKRYISSDEEENERFESPPPLKKKFAQYISKKSVDSSSKLENIPSGSENILQPDDSLLHLNLSVPSSLVKEIEQEAFVSTPTQLAEDVCSAPTSSLGSQSCQDFTSKFTNYEYNTISTSRDGSAPISTGTIDFQDKIISLLSYIKVQNEQIISLLREKKTGHSIPELKFPLKCKEELETTELLLKNSKHYEDLVSYLKSLGGTGTSNHVSRIMKFIMTDSFAKQYNFYGKRSDKHPFSELRLRDAVVDAVKTATGSTSRQIEDIIKNWLKHAPQREKKQLKKNQIMSAIEKTGVQRKAVVGQRQLLRRVKEEKLKVLSEIQTSNSDVDCNYETINSEPSCSQLPCLPSTVSTSNVYNDNSIDSDCELSVCTEVSQIDNVDCEPSVNTEVSQPTLSMNEYVSQETENSEVDLKSQLRYWATIQYKIPHNAIDSLLKILSPICPELPKDSRTLLQTPKHVETLSLESGKLVYIGLLIQLKSQLKLLGDTKIDKREILISFNVDGLPLFKSSNVQLWPILGLIKNYTNAKPFAIAIFCGCSKPFPLRQTFHKK